MPTLQVGVGDVEPLLVGVVEGVDELECSVGVELDELCVGVPSLDECVVVVGEDVRLRLCDVVCRELGVLEVCPPSPPEAVLVPTGVDGTSVGVGVLADVDSLGVPLVPCGEFPDPPKTTAAAPATSSTAVVTAPMSVLRRGPPGTPGSSKSSSAGTAAGAGTGAGTRTRARTRVSSSDELLVSEASTRLVAAPEPTSAGTSSKARVFSASTAVSRSGLITRV